MVSPWLMTSPRQGLKEVEYSMVTCEGSMPEPVPTWMGPVMVGSHSELRDAPPWTEVSPTWGRMPYTVMSDRSALPELVGVMRYWPSSPWRIMDTPSVYFL